LPIEQGWVYNKRVSIVTIRPFQRLLVTLGIAAGIASVPLSQAHAQRESAAKKPEATRSAAGPAQAKPSARKVSSGKSAASRAPRPRQAAAGQPKRVRVTIPAQGQGGVMKTSMRATPVSMRVRPDTPHSAEAPGDLVLRSSAVLVMGQNSGQLLFSRNVDQVRSIASITKLMTAMVMLDFNQPLDELITISEEDIDATRRLPSRLAAGTRLTRGEMLHLSLMSSENRATAALARTSPVGYHGFIAQMNMKARALGMHQSRFEDPTGLHNGNVATAQDLVLMVSAAMDFPAIRQFSTTAGALVDTPGNRAAQLQFNNSNQLVARPDWEIGLSKTGFIREAGRCLVMQVKINGEPMIFVLLDSDGISSRIGDATRIRRWIESGFALRLI